MKTDAMQTVTIKNVILTVQINHTCFHIFKNWHRYTSKTTISVPRVFSLARDVIFSQKSLCS